MTTEYLSVLTEDDDDDGDGAAIQDVESALADLHTHGKSMRRAGKRVLRTGKRCLDHFHNVVAEEERERNAFKKARLDYHSTMDTLHNQFAHETQAREDALAQATADALQATASADSKDKEVTAAKSEIARLQSLMVEQQNKAAADLAQAQADAAANAAANAAATRRPAVDTLNALIADVLSLIHI